MRAPRSAAAVAVALAAVVATPMTAAADTAAKSGGASASAVQKFALYAGNGQSKTTDVDRDGTDSVGDLSVFQANLYTNRARTNAFGTLTASCIFTFSNQQLCLARFKREGDRHGQIMAQGVIRRSSTSSRLAITGGTGHYRGVSGAVRMLQNQREPAFHFKLIRR